MDSWSGDSVPGLARIDLAVEQMMRMCEQVRGMSIDQHMVEYFLATAVSDWVKADEDRELFRSHVCLAWNARQAKINQERGF